MWPKSVGSVVAHSMRKHYSFPAAKSSRHHKSMTSKRWTINWTVANDCVMKLNIVRMHAAATNNNNSHDETEEQKKKKTTEVPLTFAEDLYLSICTRTQFILRVPFSLCSSFPLFQPIRALYNESQLFYSIAAREAADTRARARNKINRIKITVSWWTVRRGEKFAKNICSSPCVHWIRCTDTSLEWKRARLGDDGWEEEGSVPTTMPPHILYSFIHIYFWRFAKDAKFAIRRTKEKKHKQAFASFFLHLIMCDRDYTTVASRSYVCIIL